MVFEISRSVIFNVSYYTLGSNDSPYFSTSANKFNKPKSDYIQCGQAQKDLLPDGVVRDFYLKWDKHHLSDLSEKLYFELKNDLELLKDSYNYISKSSDISFHEAKELSKTILK